MEDNEGNELFLFSSGAVFGGRYLLIPIGNIENVVNLNMTSIRIELMVPENYVEIMFGTEMSKNAFRR